MIYLNVRNRRNSMNTLKKIIKFIALVIYKIVKYTIYAAGLFLTILVITTSLKTAEQVLDKNRALQICEKVKSVTDVQAKRIKCRYSPSNEINARASNNNDLEIVIYQGMIDFVESDDELAVVIGHELAHHMLGHLALNKYHKIPHYGYRGPVFLTSQYREAMADLLGIQLAQLAGFNPCKGGDLWKRLVKQYGHSYHGSNTHPHTLARIYNFDMVCNQ